MLDFADARSLMDVIKEYYEEHKGQVAHNLTQEYSGNRRPEIENWKIDSYHGHRKSPKQDCVAGRE